MSTLFDFLPIGAYRTSPSGLLLRANASLVRMLGYAREQDLLVATNEQGIRWYVEPGRRSAFRTQIERDGYVVDFVSQIWLQTLASAIWVRENAHAIRDANAVVQFYEGTMEDITASHETQQALLQSEERWKLALDATGDGVWDWHIQDGKEYYSRRYKEMYGYSQDKIWQESDAYTDLVHPDDKVQLLRDQEAYFSQQTPTYSNEHRVRCADGSWKWVLSRGMLISRDAQGRPLRMIGTHTDISDRKNAEALIWKQAHFDALTGLPNRRMLRLRLDDAIARCQHSGARLAIVFIDLDHFKEVNDTLGHESGDALLVQAAQRIQDCLGENDTVARMGGDEFTLILTQVQGPESLTAPLQALLAQLAQVFHLGQEQVFVSASLGVALYPDNAAHVEALFKHADQALYVAKGAGRNRYSFFTPELQEAAQTRARLASDLRVALQKQQFAVVYQPIVHLASARIHKAEALLRWHHPQRGLVSPAQFIPIAESTGFIMDIGEWVFQQAAHQVAQWRAAYGADFQISVNKSPVQFHRPEKSTATWSEQLQSMHLPGSCIAVEITEGLLLDINQGVSHHLSALQRGGIALSLDDFGTGYSSLTYLQKFDIDYIKIDQSFVRNLQPGSTDLALCRAIILMAHELGMQVIAEGVETAEQRDLLRKIGCDYGQGYLFARPMAAGAFEALMAQQ